MTLLSAGIDVREIDLTGIIPSVSSTEGAIAGQFNWGPVNQIQLTQSEQQLYTIFGGPDNSNQYDWFTIANFLAYANKAYVVRVVDETNVNTSLQARNATASNASGFLVKNDTQYVNNYNNGTLKSSFGTGDWIAKFPGDLGNSLKVSVCGSNTAFQSTLTGSLTVTANSVTVTGNSTLFTTQVAVGDLIVINSETHKVATIASNTSLTLDARHVVGAAANTAIRRWEYYNNVSLAPTTSTYSSNLGGSNDELHMVVVDQDGKWTGQQNSVLEVYQNLSKATDGFLEDGTTNYYVNVINTKSKYIRWAGHSANLANAGSTSGTTFGGVTLPENYSLIGGTNGADIGNDERVRGYGYFASKEKIDVSFILGAAANQTIATYIINNVVENRRDCVAFFSVPRAYVVDNEGDEATDSVVFRNTLPSSSFYKLTSNWKYQYDAYNDIYRYLPDNGDVAGLYARTDNQQEAWYAAAGLNRGHIKNVIKLAYNPTNAERDILYNNGINPVCSFPGEGVVLWGNKTGLAKPSAFDRMNVRRLFIVLEKAISKAAMYMLFEFNDVFTRSQFVNMVEPYLRDVQGKRGIYDFRVVCDETNNTPEVIDSNQFVGDIYIKPARTAEFITLNFVAVRSGVDFSEVAGKF